MYWQEDTKSFILYISVEGRLNVYAVTNSRQMFISQRSITKERERGVFQIATFTSSSDRQKCLQKQAVFLSRKLLRKHLTTATICKNYLLNNIWQWNKQFIQFCHTHLLPSRFLQELALVCVDLARQKNTTSLSGIPTNLVFLVTGFLQVHPIWWRLHISPAKFIHIGTYKMLYERSNST